MSAPMRLKLAIVGLGKIAHDQHVPALAASPHFELVATASPNGKLAGVPAYLDLVNLLDAQPGVQAVALCTTPQIRTGLARQALQRGLHVLLEKPPGATVAEVQGLHELAQKQRCTLFASWHSRHARGVPAAESWLAERRVRGIRVSWKEDVRIWHPGQRWLWEPGGLGVFDPGINALSILTKISAHDAFHVERAWLFFPKNCATPISARMGLRSMGDAVGEVELDFLQQGPQTWDIIVDSDDGRLHLSDGGNTLNIDGAQIETAASSEYPNLYAHFARLVRERRCDVDLAPLQLIADAFLCGHRTEVEAFIE